MKIWNRLPQWVRITFVTLGLVTAVFYGAGGVVFANMIHADALTPLPPTPDKGVYVAAATDETITLTSEEHRDDTRHDGVFGLAWDGGYGLIGNITAVDGNQITREFEVVSGRKPQPCASELAQCEEVDIEGWAYQADPSNLGLEYQDVVFDAPLGPTDAWRVDAGNGEVWAIHVHGWRASKREALRTLPVYQRAGITSLVIDYRNDVRAPADPTGLYRFGRTEWEDVEAAVRYAVDQGAEEIVIHGYSTGASLLLAFLERSDLSDLVVAAVYDSPNIDMAETVRHGASRRTIPGTPLPIPSSLVSVAMLTADLRWDIGWDQIDYIERAGQIVSSPTLVFHGLDDDRVPVETARRFAGESDRVRLVEVEGAGHVASWNIDPPVYEKILEQFVTQARQSP